ncbi:hypothetical protein [Halocatena halophila]|uniref:hypothetical protein n=1 Tax=Halocatena halophila TaxID=2814576 RepID=UPI002ED32D22
MGENAAFDRFGERHRCREFTTDHRLVPQDNAVFGAAVCPHERCAHPNPLHGDPDAFENVVFRCLGCRRIILIEAIPDGL